MQPVGKTYELWCGIEMLKRMIVRECVDNLEEGFISCGEDDSSNIKLPRSAHKTSRYIMMVCQIVFCA